MTLRQVHRLLRRPVESLSTLPGPWDWPDCEHDDLAGFRNFTDVDIECVRQALQSSADDRRPVSGETENEVVPDSSSDCHDKE
jgi:hypothetical protein